MIFCSDAEDVFAVVVLVIAIVFCQFGFAVDLFFLLFFHQAVDDSTILSVVRPGTFTVQSQQQRTTVEEKVDEEERETDKEEERHR